LERKKDHTGRDRDRKFNPLVLNEIQTAADTSSRSVNAATVRLRAPGDRDQPFRLIATRRSD